LAQRLGVEAPALDKGRVLAKAAKTGLFSQFMRPGDLQMVSGDRFVQCKRGHFPLGTGLRLVKIDEVGAGPRTVGRARTVVRGGGVRRGNRRDGLHAVGFARQGLEDFHQVGVYALGQSFVSGKEFVGRLVIELGISAQEFEKVVARSLVAYLLNDLVHLGADARHFLQTDFVHLLRRQVGGGVVTDEIRVQLLAARQLPSTYLVKARGQVFADEELLELLE